MVLPMAWMNSQETMRLRLRTIWRAICGMTTPIPATPLESMTRIKGSPIGKHTKMENVAGRWIEGVKKAIAVAVLRRRPAGDAADVLDAMEATIADALEAEGSADAASI